MGEHPLKDTWVLWQHNRASRDWSLKGYLSVAEFNTVEEFWNIYNDLPTLVHDMWFLMRKGIPPLWEDEINQKGGAYKFRIANSTADNTWLILTLHLISETICLEPELSSLVSGISLSPKNYGYSTISVWTLEADKIRLHTFPNNIPGINFKTSLYEPHIARRCG